jgi:hypothetical protein
MALDSEPSEIRQDPPPGFQGRPSVPNVLKLGRHGEVSQAQVIINWHASPIRALRRSVIRVASPRRAFASLANRVASRASVLRHLVELQAWQIGEPGMSGSFVAA